MTSWSRRKKKPKLDLSSFVDAGEFADPDAMAERLVAEATSHPGAIVTAGHGAWTVCFSLSVPQLGSVLSCKVRRSTTVEDWMILGRISARVGAPNKMMPETIEKDANATHYWIWGNDASVQPIVDVLMGRGR